MFSYCNCSCAQNQVNTTMINTSEPRLHPQLIKKCTQNNYVFAWRTLETFQNKIHVCFNLYRVSQNWRTNYLLPYRGCLNVHEKNMEKMFPTKKSIIFTIIVNDNTM
jgi:hypothetical protein